MSPRSGRIVLATCALLLALVAIDCSGGPEPNSDVAETTETRVEPTASDPSPTNTSSDLGTAHERRRPPPAPIAVEPVDPVRRTLRELVIEDQFVIAYRDDTSAPARRSLRAEMGLRLLRRFPSTNSELVVAAEPVVDEELRERLAARDEVRFAEPNVPVFASAVPDDDRFPTLWGLDNQGQVIGGETGTPDTDVDAPEAWDVTTGSSDVVVAVVDTGVDLEHVDLAQNMWVNPREVAGNGQDDDGNSLVDDTGGWDWVHADANPEDQDGHGTHVAGTIAAVGDNTIGIAGVTWQSRIMPLRALGPDGSGTTADVAMAFDYAGAAGAEVVNASLGGPYPSRAIADAIAAHPETLYVVAAGNDGADLDTFAQYPCSYALENLVCVAATDNRDELASYSNHSERRVHLAAPGTLINSTVPPFETIFSDGFSDLSTDWTTGGTTPWSDASSNGRTYVGDSPGALYQPGADSFLQLASNLDLRDRHACFARFVLRLDTATEDDRALLQTSVDGGSWRTMSRLSGTTENRWVSGAADLSDFDGSQIRLRWRFVAPSGERDDGIDLDNFSVRCQGGIYSGGEYGYYSGTSMATPHVAGAAALLFSETDLDASRVAIALQEGVDPVPALAGAVASGGRLNVERSLRLMVEAPPSPDATPAATPEASEETEEASTPRPRVSRSVSLTLRRHLVATGRVRTEGGYPTCRRRVLVKVFRGSRVVGRDVTSRYGYFRTRVPDRGARYRAVAVRVGEDDAICRRASSPRRRHRH